MDDAPGDAFREFGICSQCGARFADDRLRRAAEAVCWFDWSDNDEDAVRAIADLRAALGQT